MNSFILMTAALAALATIGFAGESQAARSAHKIVFEFTSDGSEQITSVLNNVENVRKALGGNTQIICIAHGPGIGLVLQKNTTEQKRMEELSKAGVVFAACENTMKRKQIAREDLHPFVKTVDSGVAEVVRKQAEGWAYIKSGH